jgi:hypothetical protein
MSTPDGSVAGFETIDAILKVGCRPPLLVVAAGCAARKTDATVHCHLLRAQEYLPEDKLREVQRLLHGYNGGKPVEALALGEALRQHASQQQFDLQAYSIAAAPEQLREPRVVRLGLIQNKVVLPTTAPYAAQKQVGASPPFRAPGPATPAAC